MILRDPEAENLHGTDTGRTHLSPSSIDTQLACLERFRWQYVERLELNVRPVSLSMGDAFAQAVAATNPDLGFKLVMDEHAGLIEEYGTSPFIVVPSTEQAEVDATIVMSAVGAYLRQYGAHAVREVTFRQRLRNPQTGAYSRTFDLLCRVDGLSQDGLVLIEDKLVGQIPRQDAARLVALDRQISINCYLAWRCTGIAPREVLYRYTMKPQIRRKKDESHDAFLARIAQDYTDRPEHYLVQEPTKRTTGDFLRLEAELWQWAAQRRDAHAAGVYPRNTRSCRDFGGCRFLPLCTREPGAIHQFHVRESAPDVTKVEQSEHHKEAA